MRELQLLMKCFKQSFVLTIFAMTTLVSLNAQTGPGGIGNNSSNGIWLKAGDLSQADGTAVSNWGDFSGNANNALQSNVTLQPLFYNSSALNNQPIIRFDGSNDEMAVPDAAILDGTAGITFYAVLRPNNLNGSPRGILGKRVTFTVSTEYAYTWFFHGGNRLNNDVHTQNNRYDSGSNTFSNSNNYILSFDFDGSLASGLRSRMFSGSSLIALASENSSVLPNSNQELALGALNVGYGTYLGADYAEVIHFNYSLDTLDHLIVQNYLSAKYNIALASNDLYDEDDPGNGDYDFDVAGIGQFNGSISHSDSQGSGILRINNPSDLNTNEYLLWGHDNGTAQAIDFSDVPGVVEARFERVWRNSQVNSSGTSVDVGAIDLTWDLSGFGSVTASDLRLLVDANNNGIFSDDPPISGATNVSGNLYQFAGVSELSNNLRFTLGTINSNQTPLPIELISFEANPENEQVKLSWVTLSERENDFFSIEKSRTGQDWQVLKLIDGAGTNSSKLFYHEVDENPYPGISYYRLKQTDFNGSSTYSEVLTVNFLEERNVEIFPNPATDFITVSVKGQNSVIQIYNQIGQLLFQTESQNSQFELDLSNYASGHYLLKATGLNWTESYRFLKAD